MPTVVEPTPDGGTGSWTAETDDETPARFDTSAVEPGDYFNDGVKRDIDDIIPQSDE